MPSVILADAGQRPLRCRAITLLVEAGARTRRAVAFRHRALPSEMPTVLRVGGYRFFFFSREGREPPHIHVEQAERYAKFWLSPVSLANTRGFRSNELSELFGLVLEHRTLFEENWNEHLRNQG